MKYGLYLPNFGAQHSARGLADLAREAEQAGWDGFFLWDHVIAGAEAGIPMVDPWVALAAVAMNTERIRIGTSVTPLARRRPWKLARETVTLDHLSGGRLILGVGLGVAGEFDPFGEPCSDRDRAVRLDEGLEVLAGLWSGEPFRFQGQAHTIEQMTFRPAALQLPRIPVWVGGFWPHKAPFRRAARWDGSIPLKAGGDGLLEPADVTAICDFIRSQRGTKTPFDMVVIQWTDPSDPRRAIEKVESFRRAGVTWCLEPLYMQRDSLEAMLERIRVGPPGS